MTIVDLTEIKTEQKILKAKLKSLKVNEQTEKKTQIDKFIIENRTHNCNCGDEDDMETDATSCDVQWLMISKGYVLYDGGDMEWYEPKDIKNCKEQIENLQVLDFVDIYNIHTSEGCLKNYEKYEPVSYAKLKIYKKR